MINRFGIKQPDGSYIYHELGAKAENVTIGQKNLVETLENINEKIDTKFGEGGTLTGELIPEGGISHVAKDGYIDFPRGNVFKSFSNVQGRLKIFLPVSWCNSLIKFKISILNYKERTSVDYIVSGFMNGNDYKWEECSAFSLGQYNAILSDLPVHFGNNNLKCVVSIGSDNTSWDMVAVAISDVLFHSFNNDIDFKQLSENWEIVINASNDISNFVTLTSVHIAGDIKIHADNADKAILADAKSYTDTEIAKLVNGAPDTLNTLNELATAIGDNQSAIEAINTIASTKTNVSDFEQHTSNSTVHITEEERLAWNAKQEKLVIDNALSDTSMNPIQNKIVTNELNTKVTKEDGKGLSSNDFTNGYKSKLDGIAEGANKYEHPDSGVIAGSYRKVTVDSMGHVTEGSNEVLSIAEGGTGATTKEDALVNFGIEAAAAELNILKDIKISSTELNYVEGVRDNIQTQLDSKASNEVATETKNGLMAAVDKAKLDSISENANNYVHPSYSRQEEGLYKVAVDELGHVSGVNSVTKEDILALGLSDKDTTYENATVATDGLMSSTDKYKLDTIETGANKFVLQPANGATLGGVKTSSLVTDVSEYTACPIVNGVPYYQGTKGEPATDTSLGLVKIGNNITNTSGTISVTKTNVESALGYQLIVDDTGSVKLVYNDI